MELYIVEVNAAPVNTEETKGGSLCVSAVLTYDDVELVDCPNKKENPIEGCTLGDAVVLISPIETHKE